MKLDESINNIRTMQKSYDTLADGIAITAKEDTLLQESESIKQAIANEVAQQSTLEEVKNAVENIDFTPIEEKIDNIDLSSIKGDNPEATNSKILDVLCSIATTMYKGVPVVSQTTDATIAPNVWNVWGEVTSLTITKGTDINGVVNNYVVRFTALEGAAITFDGFSLSWFGGEAPTWTAGNTYEISIVDNIALWAEIEPAA